MMQVRGSDFSTTTPKPHKLLDSVPFAPGKQHWQQLSSHKRRLGMQIWHIGTEVLRLPPLYLLPFQFSLPNTFRVLVKQSTLGWQVLASFGPLAMNVQTPASPICWCLSWIKFVKLKPSYLGRFKFQLVFKPRRRSIIAAKMNFHIIKHGKFFFT